MLNMPRNYMPLKWYVVSKPFDADASCYFFRSLAFFKFF